MLKDTKWGCERSVLCYIDNTLWCHPSKSDAQEQHVTHRRWCPYLILGRNMRYQLNWWSQLAIWHRLISFQSFDTFSYLEMQCHSVSMSHTGGVAYTRPYWCITCSGIWTSNTLKRISVKHALHATVGVPEC